MTLRQRLQPDDGATTAEYIAVMLLIVAVIGTISVSGLAQPITGAIRAAFCQVSIDSDGCGGDVPVAGEEVIPPTCTLATSREAIDGSVTVASVDIGGDVSITMTETRTGDDMTYDVNLAFTGELGAKVMEGGRVEVGEGGLRAGKQGELAAGVDATYSPTFRFDNREDAEALVERTRDLVTGPIDDAWSWQTLVPVWGPGRIAKNQIDRINDYDPGDVDVTRIEGGVFVEGGGSAYGGGAGAQGDARVGTTVGGEYDHNTGDTTLYYKLNSEVAASLGMQVVGASGGLESEVVAKVTMDDDWNLSDLELGWTGTARGGLDTIAFDQLWFAEGTSMPANVSDALKLGIDATAEDTWALEATGTIDLTDPRLRTAGSDFLQGLVDGDLEDTLGASQTLGDYMINDSDLLVQYHTGESERLGFDAAGGHVLAFGLGGGHSTSESTLQDAWYRPGGGDWTFGACDQ